MNSSLDKLLITEYHRIDMRIQSIDIEVSTLPIGSIQKKNINGRFYAYLQYRDGRHIKSDYISYEDCEDVYKKITQRKELLSEKKLLIKDKLKIEKALGSKLIENGAFSAYKPVRSVDYSAYTIFMSELAHDLKRLGKDTFIKEYSDIRVKGINGRYLKGLLDYLQDNPGIQRKSTSLVLDPFTYQMYFKYKDKSVLKESLSHAIPQFLKQGLLITDVQEAVNGALG